METRKELAKERKACGRYNCAQAVASTYADVVGVDEETILAATSAFGTGMGNMQGTCGALVGAGAVLGLALKDRVEARRRMAGIMAKFQERNKATRCCDLKGIGTGRPLRACNDCVADAAEFLEEALEG